MKKIVLDFGECKNISNIHERIKKTFDLPNYYGGTPDALWDCFDGLFYDEGEILVGITNTNSLKSDLKEALKPIFKVFDDVHTNTPNVKFNIIS